MPVERDTLKGLIIQGRYAEAYQFFGELLQPSPDDQRWGAIAFIHLNQLLQAQTLLLSAKSKGCAEAAIELASVSRLLGEIEQAEATLKELDLTQLAPFDRALALREQGVQEFVFGKMRLASQTLALAWEAALQSEYEQTLLPGIGLSLSYTYLELGLEKRALYYLSFALPLANSNRRRELLVAQAACELYNGELVSALNTLQLAKMEAAPGLLASLLYFEGLVNRYQGRAEQALYLFDTCIQQSKAADVPETECYAVLEAVAVALDLGQTKQAQRYLNRAAAIPVTTKVQGMVKLREGHLLRQINIEAAKARLFEATDIFAELEMQRELAWAYLHLAEVYFKDGEQKDAESMIEHAMCCRAAFGDSKSVALELRSLPELCRHIQCQEHDAFILWQDWQAVDGAVGVELRVSTLGKVSLCLDQNYLRPNASLLKTVELLAYFERKGDALLGQALADIFPDRDEKSARMHFHLIRQEIARLVPGLKIDFDRQQRMYKLRSVGVRLKLDITEALQHLNVKGIQGISQALAVYKGPFLRESDSEWADEERTNLEWLIVKVGLETLEDYYERGDDTLCLELATRLLEVAPLNEGIHELLIRATGRLRGAVAARQVAKQSSQQFLQNVGEIPPNILQLQLGFSA